MRALAVGLLVIAAAASEGGAQVVRPPRRPDPVPPRPTQPAARPPLVRPDTLRRPVTPADSAALRDTTRPPDLVRWPEPDSVMRELLARAGFTATRYRGDVVIFDAGAKTIDLRGNAAVERAGTILVADSIIYNDSTRMVVAMGDTVIVRDPTQPKDLIAFGMMTYDLEERRGVATNVRTALQSGETWYVQGHRAGVVQEDSLRGQQSAFYARGGTVTSCDLTTPHYHFESREIKMVSRNILVARPAILYIADVPVAWLPFVFQDLRSGRRSGMLPPRFGVSDIVRNSPSYRRHVENVGYYFALSDYTDATLSLDWRSGARGNEFDPGWIRYNGEWRYRWLNRFLAGNVGASHLRQRDGLTTTRVSWAHQQEFSLRSRLSANLNYSSNTTVQRRTTTNPYQQLSTIQSQLNYQYALGPASLSIGGTRSQYPGTKRVEQTLPTLNISTKSLNLAPWLVWTPTLSMTNRESFNNDLGGAALAFRFQPRPDGGLDSVRVRRDTRNTSLSFDTPLQFFDFVWQNSIAITDQENDFPESFTVYPDPNDTSSRATRLFARSYETSIDWRTGINLPRISQGRWNIVPSVAIANVDPGAGFLVRTTFTGDRYVRQSKRAQYGLSISPTLFSLIPGFAGYTRFRHAVSPTLSYSYSPSATVSDEFLRAINRTRVGYLGDLAQNLVTLGMSTNLEGKRVLPGDTSETGTKSKLVSLQLSSLTYDFERLREVQRRAREAGRPEPGTSAGFTTNTFSYTATSDLLPGLSFRSAYSLFQGDPVSDTAVFKPYRTSVDVSFNINRTTNPFVALARVFGIAVPRAAPLAETTHPTAQDTAAQITAQQPLAGSYPRSLGGIGSAPSGQGWQASFTYSSQRQRPIIGGTVEEIDPLERCRPFESNPFTYESCLNTYRNSPGTDPIQSIGIGGVIRRVPPTQSLGANFSFNVTPKWSAQWSTQYDFVQAEFASHIVSLQRELHDWRAIFAFTQAPNGSFAFNFFIALKAQPDLKFDYNRQSYRGRSN